MRILLDTQAVIKIIYDENDIDISFKNDVKRLTHTDPFDRLLIAQAKSEKLTIATTDAKFKFYPELKIIDVSK